jgi:AAA domain, putative AbiEii toxin, Type IV TA system/AAA ATPase domain
MYLKVSIRNFRGIESLDASGFRRINLILGRNNSGKTTFLESLFLLGGATNPQFATSLGQLRGQRSGNTNLEGMWRSLFHRLNPRIPVEIRGRWAEEPRDREIRIEGVEVSTYIGTIDPSLEGENGVAAVTPESVFGGLCLRSSDASGNELITRTTFDHGSSRVIINGARRADVIRTTMLSARALTSSARDAQQFSSLRKTKRDKEVIDALRIIEPNLQAIEVLSEPNGPSIYLDIGLDTLVPLAVCGEGMVRLFSIILELIASRNGVLLIDEIDNGLHYNIMPKLWKLLGELVEKHEVQVFGTTHSDDIIRSALEAFVDKEGTLGLFRIDKRGDRHAMVGYSDEAMKGVLEDHFEVRG